MAIVYLVIREAEQVWPRQILGVVDQEHLEGALKAVANDARNTRRLAKGARVTWDEEHKPGLGVIRRLKARRGWREGKTLGYTVEPLEMNSLKSGGIFEQGRVEL